MSDLRIEYLKLTDNRPTANSAALASMFMYVTMVGLALEKDNTKSIPLRLWLVGVIIQTVVRSFVKVSQGRMHNMGNTVTHEDIANINRTVDNLELAGYVWFALGNILFLENQACQDESPFVYFLCVIYFSVSYATMVIFHIIQISLIVSPPSATADRLYWIQNRFIYPENDVDELIPTLREYPIYAHQSAHSNDKLSPNGLTHHQTLYWTEWLASYGCVAGPGKVGNAVSVSTPHALDSCSPDLRTGLPLKPPDSDTTHPTTPTSNMSQTQKEKGVLTLSLEAELCSICLFALIAPLPTPLPTPSPSSLHSPSLSSATLRNNVSNQSLCEPTVNFYADCSTKSSVAEVTTPEYHNIVRYPCPGQHYFHVHCLHSWMQSATERKWDLRGREKLVYARCPCCRQSPSVEEVMSQTEY